MRRIDGISLLNEFENWSVENHIRSLREGFVKLQKNSQNDTILLRATQWGNFSPSDNHMFFSK